MKNLKSIILGLFRGMNIIFGGESEYIKYIVNRDDREALREDMEAIGGDMWKVIDREKKRRGISDAYKDQRVSESPSIQGEKVDFQTISSTPQEGSPIAGGTFCSCLLPTPSELRQYEEVIPGLAGTIVSMAKGEQKHRHKMESMMTKPFSLRPW